MNGRVDDVDKGIFSKKVALSNIKVGPGKHAEWRRDCHEETRGSANWARRLSRMHTLVLFVVTLD